MKYIKDMSVQELNRVLAQVVYRITDPIQDVMKTIIGRFESIERKLEQEIEYPNAYKRRIMQEIAELNKEIDTFLDKVKELKRKEKE